jgi:hypothetical protein
MGIAAFTAPGGAETGGEQIEPLFQQGRGPRRVPAGFFRAEALGVVAPSDGVEQLDRFQQANQDRVSGVFDPPAFTRTGLGCDEAGEAGGAVIFAVERIVGASVPILRSGIA